jgi:hypothetical protein
MKSTLSLLGLAIILVLPAHANDATRPAVKGEAVEAARAPKLGEGDPVPAPKARVAKPQRQAARADRKVEGAAAARDHQVGEGNPVPVKAAKVPKDERAIARAERKAESRRANKAGEITARGEKSY